MVAKGGGGGRGGGSRGGGSSSRKNTTSSTCNFRNSTCNRRTNYTSTSAKQKTPSPFKQTFVLDGDRFTDGLQTATLAIQCFCILAIIGILIWSFKIKKQRDPARSVFKFFGLGLALISTLISLGLQVMDQFLREFRVTVNGYYILIYVIIAWFSFQATLLLLKVAYSLVTSRYQHSRAKAGSSSPGIQWLHRTILVLLGILWLIAIYYFARYQIFVVLSSSKIANYSQRYGQIATGFKILVILAVLEASALGVIAWNRGRKAIHPSKIGTYLVFALLFPLLVRSVVDAAITATYQIRKKPIATPNAAHLVYALLVDLSTVVVFAAIVLIGLQNDWSVQYSPAIKHDSAAFEPMKHTSVSVQQVGTPNQGPTEYFGAHTPTPPPGQHGQPVYTPQYGNPQAQPLVGTFPPPPQQQGGYNYH